MKKVAKIVQRWHTELVKYEKHDKVWRRIEKIYYFTTSYKNNVVIFVKTPPV